MKGGNYNFFQIVSLELSSEEEVTRRNLRLTDKRSGTVCDHNGPELCSIQTCREFLGGLFKV